MDRRELNKNRRKNLGGRRYSATPDTGQRRRCDDAQAAPAEVAEGRWERSDGGHLAQWNGLKSLSIASSAHSGLELAEWLNRLGLRPPAAYCAPEAAALDVMALRKQIDDIDELLIELGTYPVSEIPDRIRSLASAAESKAADLSAAHRLLTELNPDDDPFEGTVADRIAALAARTAPGLSEAQVREIATGLRKRGNKDAAEILEAALTATPAPDPREAAIAEARAEVERCESERASSYEVWIASIKAVPAARARLAALEAGGEV